MDFLFLVGFLALVAIIANNAKQPGTPAPVINIASSPAYHANVPTPAPSVPPPFQALGGGADITQTPPLVIAPARPGDLGYDAPPANQNALTDVSPPLVTPMNVTLPAPGNNAFPPTSPVVNYIALPAITSVPPEPAPTPAPVISPFTPRPTMVNYDVGKIPLEVM